MRWRILLLSTTVLLGGALAGCGAVGEQRAEATDPQIQPGDVTALEAGQYPQVGVAVYGGPDTGADTGDADAGTAGIGTVGAETTNAGGSGMQSVPAATNGGEDVDAGDKHK